jgi:hypothetical protein
VRGKPGLPRNTDRVSVPAVDCKGSTAVDPAPAIGEISEGRIAGVPW